MKLVKVHGVVHVDKYNDVSVIISVVKKQGRSA